MGWEIIEIGADLFPVVTQLVSKGLHEALLWTLIFPVGSVGDCKLLCGKQLKVFAFNLYLEYITQAEKRLEKSFQKASFYLS